MFKFRYLLLLCIFLNTSCDILPKYTKPMVPLPTRWSKDYPFQIKTAIDLPDMYWWKQYNIQELNELIHKALICNNQLNIALASVDYAQSQLQQVKFNWLPTLSFLGGYSQMPILGEPGLFYMAVPLYAINVFQQYKQQTSAKALFIASLHAKNVVRLLVIAEVAKSFFTLIAERENLNLYRQLLKDYHLYSSLIHKQYGSGLIAEDDIFQLESDIVQVKSGISMSLHNIQVSKNMLHYLINENPGDITVHTSFTSINTNSIIPATLPVCVLHNRPDVQEAEARLMAANENVGVATANLLPTIDLGSFLGQGTAVDGPIRISEATVGFPLINLPLFAQIKATKAQYKAAYINFNDTIKRALRDIDDGLSAYAAYGKQYRDYMQAMSRITQQCDLTKKRYQHGIDSKIEITRCRIKLNRLALIVNQTKLDKMLITVRLYQDLAGGYHAVG